MNKTIDSIQALRAWAFLGIFVSHTGFICFQGGGAWGVSVFFILSGFLMTYNYYGKNRIQTVSLKNNIQFAWGKIKHFYPLHIITMLAMLIFMFTGEDVIKITQVSVKLVLNVLLLQCWIPIQSSINGVSWYLCVTVFLYFVFPYILKTMEENYSVYKAKKMMAFLFLAQIGVGFIGSCLPTFSYWETGWIEQDVTRWFVYFFPPVRALDFVIGCNMGYCFIASKTKTIQKKTVTFFELITIILIVMANICFVASRAKIERGGGNLFVNAHQAIWWTYTVIFTISSCMIIWLFAKSERGNISKYMVNRALLYIGNISSSAFLIHTVIFRYIDAICNMVFGAEFRLLYGKWLKLSLGFILTIIATQVWLVLIHKIEKRKIQ